jgi:hypothetical protein
MKEKQALEAFSRAARPTLFDAAAYPELLIALVYANLMSPALWELKRRIHTAVRCKKIEGKARRIGATMEAIHSYVNKKFYHPSPLDLAKICGRLDLAEERRRLPAGAVDAALASILRSFEKFRVKGKLKRNQDIFEMVAQGKFPEYEYSGIDVIEALGRTLQRKHRPLGITMCADEAVLIASLALVEGGVSPEDIAILGSPAHYTLFVDHGIDRFWFNGKQEFHNARSWREAAEQFSGNRIKEAFKSRIVEFDRLVTPLGTHLIGSNLTSVAPDRLNRLYSDLEAFFGFDIRQTAEAARGDVRYIEDSSLNLPPLNVGALGQGRHVEKSVCQLAAAHPDSIYELALYAFRSIHVRRPEVYVRVALRGHRVQELAAGLEGVAHAVETVSAIPGNHSIMGTPQRLALPDEVLQFQSGTSREKALLLYCLIHHAPAIPHALKDETTIDLTAEVNSLQVANSSFDAACLDFLSGEKRGHE